MVDLFIHLCIDFEPLMVRVEGPRSLFLMCTKDMNSTCKYGSTITACTRARQHDAGAPEDTAHGSSRDKRAEKVLMLMAATTFP